MNGASAGTASALLGWRQRSKETRREGPGEPSSWQSWVVDPADRLYYIWLQLMVPPVVYNWVVIILRTCFPSIATRYLAMWLTLDYACDLMYAVDMIVALRSGYLEQGILIRDPVRLKSRYLSSRRFFRDLASLLPTDLFYLVLGARAAAVRINRLLRTPRLNEALDRMETRTSYPNTFRISKLMIYIFVLIHWNACLYFALSDYIGFGSDGWVYPNISRPEFASTRRQYFYCFWFSAQIFTTVGDTPLPGREEAFLFMIADLLIAVLVFASIVGNVGNVITSLRDRDNVFFPNHELVKNYLRGHHICKELRQRIDNWTEIAVSVHLPTLSKVTIFKSCEKSLLEELVLKLTPQVFSPGEYVCRKGDVGHEMYIIKEGKLAVVADDGVTEFAVLTAGNFFGEISILNIKGNKSGNRRTANIRSVGYSDLFGLSKEDLTDVLSEYPAAKRHLEEKGRQILTKMGMLDDGGATEGAGAQQVETKIGALESALEALQTKLARLMAEAESSNRKSEARVALLESGLAARRGRPAGVGGARPASEEPRGMADAANRREKAESGEGRDGGELGEGQSGDEGQDRLENQRTDWETDQTV
ncbi:cyclic nucleotide-gated channel alpha-4 isoform X2 [Stigmatopora argus]